MKPTSHSKSDATAVSQILRHLARTESSAWCFLPLHQSSITLCSQTFLDFWQISVPLQQIFESGLPLDETCSLPPPPDLQSCVPALGTLVKMVVDGRLYELQKACESHLEIRMEPILAGDGAPVGRLMIFGQHDRVQIPAHTLQNVRTFLERRSLLSAREQEVLDLVTRGLTNRQAGEELEISAKTVEKHRQRLMSKLQIKSAPDLLRVAVVAELVSG